MQGDGTLQVNHPVARYNPFPSNRKKKLRTEYSFPLRRHKPKITPFFWGPFSRPLPEPYRRTDQQRRPLPPTPDGGDDSLRRHSAAVSAGAASNGNSSGAPQSSGLANSRAMLNSGGANNSSSTVMPDLLPQGSPNTAGARTSIAGGPVDTKGQPSFMPFGFSAEAHNQATPVGQTRPPGIRSPLRPHQVHSSKTKFPLKCIPVI